VTADTATATPSSTPTPTQASGRPVVIVVPEPTDTPEPTPTVEPADTLEPTGTPELTDTATAVRIVKATATATPKPLIVVPGPARPTRLVMPTLAPAKAPTATATRAVAKPPRLPVVQATSTAAPVATKAPRATAVQKPRPPVAPAKPAPSAIPAPALPAFRLNEVLTIPADVNAAGDARQWVELFNGYDRPLALRGWSLTAGSGANLQIFALPDGLVMQPGEYLVLGSRLTGLSLQPGGDVLRLVGPAGQPADAVIVPALDPGDSYSRDREGAWHDDWAPSPGSLNMRPRVPEN
jgi:hypothetical protein